MLNKKALAGTPSTPPVFVEDVFSTYLYTGNSSTQTITNGIDLSGKGGLVWIKSRSDTTSNFLFDTIRGALNEINSNNTEAQVSLANSLTAFNANGFSLGSSAQTNFTGETQVSWTFRKQAKFFDIVTYTGNGSGSGQTINHNLGSVPGCIMIKNTTTSPTGWCVFHKDVNGYFNLTTSGASSTVVVSNVTSTSFDVANYQFVNGSGDTMVAYLFAHNAGGFGTAGTDNVISCGSVTLNGSGAGSVTLGYEPQWVLLKNSQAAENWQITDNMRGMPVGSADALLLPNSSAAESSYDDIDPTSTGFNVKGLNSSQTYIYIAIRRGPMKTPTSGTSVFSPQIYTEILTNPTTLTTSFPTDLHMISRRTGSIGFYVSDRLRGSILANENLLATFSTAAETDYSASPPLFTSNTGIVITNLFNNSSGDTDVSYQFRRAPGFFDVVCYTGTGSATTVTHSLGVVPEMMIVKNRSTAANWMVYHKGLNGGTSPQSYFINLNLTTEETNNTGTWNNTAPTSSVFSVGSAGNINNTSNTYVAYLFATVTGVSKVGFYTGTGTTLTIDCGFTAGARFVLIKCADNAGNWFVWDTARNIISGDDPYLLLNSTAAEVTNTDYIDPVNSGFQISSTAPAAINQNNGKFIFIAIA